MIIFQSRLILCVFLGSLTDDGVITKVPSVLPYLSSKSLNSRKKFILFYFVLEREGKKERPRNIDLLFHSLVDSCMCPDQGRTHNLDVWESLSNQLGYLARA